MAGHCSESLLVCPGQGQLPVAADMGGEIQPLPDASRGGPDMRLLCRRASAIKSQVQELVVASIGQGGSIGRDNLNGTGVENKGSCTASGSFETPACLSFHWIVLDP